MTAYNESVTWMTWNMYMHNISIDSVFFKESILILIIILWIYKDCVKYTIWHDSILAPSYNRHEQYKIYT